MNLKKSIGLMIAILVLIISFLIFLSLSLIYGRASLIYIGILSIVFSGVSYLMHAFIGNRKFVNLFISGYYFLGILLLLIYTTIISFNLNGLIILLIFILFSFILIYWRITLKE